MPRCSGSRSPVRPTSPPRPSIPPRHLRPPERRASRRQGAVQGRFTHRVKGSQMLEYRGRPGGDSPPVFRPRPGRSVSDPVSNIRPRGYPAPHGALVRRSGTRPWRRGFRKNWPLRLVLALAVCYVLIWAACVALIAAGLSGHLGVVPSTRFELAPSRNLGPVPLPIGLRGIVSDNEKGVAALGFARGGPQGGGGVRPGGGATPGSGPGGCGGRPDRRRNPGSRRR